MERGLGNSGPATHFLELVQQVRLTVAVLVCENTLVAAAILVLLAEDLIHCREIGMIQELERDPEDVHTYD